MTQPPFPSQDPTCPWPTEAWPRGALPQDLNRGAYERAFNALTQPGPEDGHCYAVLVVHRGRIVAEHYGDGATADSTLASWSMAKSQLHAVAGLMAQERLIDLDAPTGLPAWAGDPRAAITLRQLFAMRSGLEFREDYEDGTVSDVIEMLWGAGKDDVAAYAAAKPLLHAPGSTFSYSSGTTNLIARILADRLGGEAALLARLQQDLFAPLGITGTVPKVDGTGLWKASSFCFCTAEDFARFGLLYLRGGCWENRPLLEESWVDGARTPTTLTAEEGYGLHWWIDPADPRRFYASGYEGQRILCDPARDVLALRLGKSPNGEVPRIMAPLHALVAAFPELES